MLEEEHNITLSRRSVTRVLSAAGLRSPRKRRARKHRSRRERMPQEGMLLQVDGSTHDWLEGRGPRLTLIGAVDDATGEPVHAVFREQEDAEGYFLLLRDSIRRKGVPFAWYSDRHGIFKYNGKEPWTLTEELAGRREPTQVGCPRRTRHQPHPRPLASGQGPGRAPLGDLPGPPGQGTPPGQGLLAG